MNFLNLLITCGVRRIFLVLISFTFFSLSLSVAQKPIKWSDLSAISFTKKMDELMGFKVDLPVFGPSIKALEGEYIEIKGYIIPVDGYKSQSEFVLSAYPYSMCFFCGNAGPETVMEVKTKKPIEYTTEQVVIKGKLKLNDTDINSLMYILEDSQLVN